MIDIDSADGADNLAIRPDPDRPGYAIITNEDTLGDFPATDIGSYRVVDLVRMLSSLETPVEVPRRAASRYFEARQ